MASRNTPAENRADLLRVLIAIGLLAWLSTWDGPREGPRVAAAETPATSAH